MRNEPDEELETLPDFPIPANYTDSGLLMGMFKTRNAIEAGLTAVPLVYLDAKLHMSLSMHCVFFVLVVMPVVFLALIGIDGDSLTERLSAIIKYFIHRRKLHMRRVGYRYDTEQLGKYARKAQKKKERRK